MWKPVWAKKSGWMIFQKIQLKRFVIKKLLFCNAYSEQVHVFVATLSTVRPRGCYVQTVMKIGILIGSLAKRNVNVSSTTIIITIWQSSREESPIWAFYQNIQHEYFVFNRISHANTYSELVNFLSDPFQLYKLHYSLYKPKSVSFQLWPYQHDILILRRGAL